MEDINLKKESLEKKEYSKNNTTIMRSVFYQSPPSLYRHVDAVLADRASYCQMLENMIQKDTVDSLSSPTKARVVAALHIAKEHQLLESLLPFCAATDLSKALSLLDMARQIRQIQRRIDAIETSHPHLLLMETLTMATTSPSKKGPTKLARRSLRKQHSMVRKGKINLLRRQLAELQSQQRGEMLPHTGSEEHSVVAAAATGGGGAPTNSSSAVQELIASASVSGSLARKIRHWAKTNHSSDFLEFVMLSNMPTAPWKNLANIVHFCPTDFDVDYFLTVVHGTEPHNDCFVTCMRDLESSTNDSLMIAQKFFRLDGAIPANLLGLHVFANHAPYCSEYRRGGEAGGAHATQHGHLVSGGAGSDFETCGDHCNESCQERESAEYRVFYQGD
jgi:hypothetical protein